MKKKVLPLILASAMALCAVPAMADDAIEVVSTTQTVTVNGETVDFEGFNVEGFNYFKLDDVAAATGKNVTFDGKTFTIETEETTTEAPAEETATEETTEAPAEETTTEETTEATTEETATEETATTTEEAATEETATTTEEAATEETTEATTEEAATEETTAEEVEYSSIEVEGVEYFKLRDLADIIGFGVDYDAATSTVVITTEAE